MPSKDKESLDLYPKLTDKQIVNKIKFLLNNLKEDPNNDFARSGKHIIYHGDLCGSYQYLLKWILNKKREDLELAMWYLVGN